MWISVRKYSNDVPLHLRSRSSGRLICPDVRERWLQEQIEVAFSEASLPRTLFVKVSILKWSDLRGGLCMD